jgi:hypothetical protein
MTSFILGPDAGGMLISISPLQTKDLKIDDRDAPLRLVCFITIKQPLCHRENSRLMHCFYLIYFRFDNSHPACEAPSRCRFETRAPKSMPLPDRSH